MKERYIFYGTKAPLRKSINRAIYKTNKFLSSQDFADLVNSMRENEQREYQYTVDWKGRLVSNGPRLGRPLGRSGLFKIVVGYR